MNGILPERTVEFSQGISFISEETSQITTYYCLHKSMRGKFDTLPYCNFLH